MQSKWNPPRGARQVFSAIALCLAICCCIISIAEVKPATQPSSDEFLAFNRTKAIANINLNNDFHSPNATGVDFQKLTNTFYTYRIYLSNGTFLDMMLVKYAERLALGSPPPVHGDWSFLEEDDQGYSESILAKITGRLVLSLDSEKYYFRNAYREQASSATQNQADTPSSMAVWLSKLSKLSLAIPVIALISTALFGRSNLHTCKLHFVVPIPQTILRLPVLCTVVFAHSLLLVYNSWKLDERSFSIVDSVVVHWGSTAHLIGAAIILGFVMRYAHSPASFLRMLLRDTQKACPEFMAMQSLEVETLSNGGNTEKSAKVDQ